jgi:hypothetical protein
VKLYVRFGSSAEVNANQSDVRFTFTSRHRQVGLAMSEKCQKATSKGRLRDRAEPYSAANFAAPSIAA